MPRSTRKKSKTGIYHVMLRVNTVPCSYPLFIGEEFAAPIGAIVDIEYGSIN